MATALERDRRGLAARVLAIDRPPRALYTLAVAAGLCGLGCLVLAAVSWWAGRRRRPLLPPEAAAGGDRGPRGAGSRAPWVPAAAGVAAGVLVAGLAVPVTLAGGEGWRAAAYRQAEDDARLHTVRRPAERQRRSAGPVQPSDRLWDVPLPAQSLDRDHTGDEVSMTAVPGWDVVLVSQLLERPTVNRLVALSLAGGEVLWRYGRRGLFVAMVDPGSGRVALVADGPTSWPTATATARPPAPPASPASRGSAGGEG